MIATSIERLVTNIVLLVGFGRGSRPALRATYNTLNGALRAPSRQSQLRCSSLHSQFLYAMKIFDKSLSVPGKAPQEQNVYIRESN
jgi:hypothetical protein